MAGRSSRQMSLADPGLYGVTVGMWSAFVWFLLEAGPCRGGTRAGRSSQVKAFNRRRTGHTGERPDGSAVRPWLPSGKVVVWTCLAMSSGASFTVRCRLSLQGGVSLFFCWP